MIEAMKSETSLDTLKLYWIIFAKRQKKYFYKK